MELFCNNSNYIVVATQDGSPTLQLLSKEGQDIEKMHHSGGAFAETQMIYGRAVRETIADGGSRFISVGLGLGYNEILIACEAQKNGLMPDILSFESEDFLIQAFLENIRNSHSNPVHQKIFDIYGVQYGFDVRPFMLQLLDEGRWKIQGALNEASLEHKALLYQCVLFDAFSSKTSPELWSEDFLKGFLAHFCEGPCRFSTYACTGNLRRALVSQGFEFYKEIGFLGKRHSSFAILKA